MSFCIIGTIVLKSDATLLSSNTYWKQSDRYPYNSESDISNPSP